MTTIPKTVGQLKLNYLQRNYNHLAKQGSEAWKTGRQTRFGGSEMGKLMSNKLDQVIQSKQQNFRPNQIYCLWGNIFEIIAKQWLEHTMNITIHEFGSIPSSMYPIAYSPDGVYIDTKHNDLILLEIKCPFLRGIHKDTTVSKEYIAQVQTGMNILPCNYTNFIQFKFRRCYQSQVYKVGHYDRLFHNKYERGKNDQCLFHGVLIWNEHEGDSLRKTPREEFILETPSNTYVSFKGDNPEDIVKELTQGSYCFFKCFYVHATTVVKDDTFLSKQMNELWNAYGKLMEDYYNHNIHIIQDATFKE